MAIKKTGGSNPNAGQVTTTMGMRASRPPLCLRCGLRKEGQLYTINANGQQVCADCAGGSNLAILAPCENGLGADCGCHEEPDEG